MTSRSGANASTRGMGAFDAFGDVPGVSSNHGSHPTTRSRAPRCRKSKAVCVDDSDNTRGGAGFPNRPNRDGYRTSRAHRSITPGPWRSISASQRAHRRRPDVERSVTDLRDSAVASAPSGPSGSSAPVGSSSAPSRTPSALSNARPASPPARAPQKADPPFSPSGPPTDRDTATTQNGAHLPRLVLAKKRVASPLTHASSLCSRRRNLRSASEGVSTHTADSTTNTTASAKSASAVARSKSPFFFSSEESHRDDTSASATETPSPTASASR